MLAKRIIPCLDVTGGRVVKGVNFVELRDAGDPVEIAARYNEQGADELTFLDITATSDGRDLILHIIEAVASQVFIPLTVGGGVRTVEDVRRLLNAGADKTSFNSAAIANPDVIAAASAKYGAQCIVVAIDAKRRLAEDEKRCVKCCSPKAASAKEKDHEVRGLQQASTVAAQWRVVTPESNRSRSASGRLSRLSATPDRASSDGRTAARGRKTATTSVGFPASASRKAARAAASEAATDDATVVVFRARWL